MILENNLTCVFWILPTFALGALSIWSILGYVGHSYKMGKKVIFCFLPIKFCFWFICFIQLIVSPIRQLVIQYVRRRATLGSKFHRVDWSSLSNLPASPGACEKRMSFLRRNTKFRKAIMNLCNLLSERYVKHLEKTQDLKLDNNDSRVPVHVLSREGHNLNVSDGVEDTEDANFEEKLWDDFDDKKIQAALDVVLRLKRIANLETSKRIGSAYEESLNVRLITFWYCIIYASGVR